MALARLAVKVGKAGKASPHAAYIAREGRYADRLEKGERLEATEAGNMPAWAQSNPQAFWQAADAHERANGTTYREMEIALPRELDASQRRELVAGFVQQELGDRHAYQWAIHVPTAADGGEQPHVHLMFSERTRDGIERDPEQYFKRYNAKAPERGGCKKANTGKDAATRKVELKELRGRWEVACNQALERAGQDARIDMRSYAERGRAEAPERKQLPSQWRGQGKAQVIEFRAAKAEQARAVSELRETVPDVRGQVVEIERERERQAVKRLESMPLDELRQHVTATRSPGVQALMRAMPEAQALEKRAQDAMQAEQKAAGEIERHSRGYAEWRQGAPVRAFLHRHGVWKDAQASKVDDWLAKQEQIKATASKDLEQAKAEAPELAKRLRPLAEQQHAKMETDHARAAPILAQREQAAQEAQKQRRFELMKEQAEQQAARQMAERVMEAADLHRRGKLKDVPPHLAQVLEASQKSANTRLEREMKLRQTFTDPKMREGVAQMLKPYAKQIENGLDRGLSR